MTRRSSPILLVLMFVALVACVATWTVLSEDDPPGAAATTDREHTGETDAPRTLDPERMSHTAPLQRGTHDVAPTPPDTRSQPDAPRTRQRVRPPEPVARRTAAARSAPGWLDAQLVAMEDIAPLDLADDLDALQAHFETDSPTGGVVVGTDSAAVAAAPDASTIRFGPGCHVLDTRGLNARDRWPEHLTVEGAGKDETLVRIAEEIASRGRLTALTLRDLTVHCNDDGLTDLRRREPATIRLVRCRVIGFDAGHGGCDLFNGNVGAFLAEDSNIEMGYGRSPGSTELFDVRGGACVVRLERCTIVGPIDRTLFFRSSTMGFVLVECELRDLWPHSRSQVEENASVRLRDCTITYLDSDSTARRETRPVSALNPAWTLPELR